MKSNKRFLAFIVLAFLVQRKARHPFAHHAHHQCPNWKHRFHQWHSVPQPTMNEAPPEVV